MIRSYWRKAHFLLALVASSFLIITSVTGVILSFEPVSNRLSESHVGNAKDDSIGTIIQKLESTYLEVIELKVNEDQQLQVSIIDEEGEFRTFLADPNTGKEVGEIEEEHALFSFSRTLHRSLFYGTIGRLAIGITSFLLFFIAVSGCFLIIQRQLSLKKFFSKVIKDNAYQYWHTVIGRWFFPLLMLISFTGVYLSLDRFEMFAPEKEINHSIDFDSMTDSPSIDKLKFKLFNETKLADLEWIQFPFSPDVEDYYHLRLSDRELIVNQFNGSVISEIPIDSTTQFKSLMFNLHTGKTSAVWSVVLGVASLSILFFVFSGFKIALKRRKRTGKNKYTKDQSSIVILYGSEGGQTVKNARKVYDQLVKIGHKVYLDQLNNYQRFERMEHLLIFTSTYGDGQPPTNARKFLDRFAEVNQPRSFTFSVVGFGSTNYLKYCKFAKDVHELLSKSLAEVVPLYTVNNQSYEELDTWRLNWSESMNISLDQLKKDIVEPLQDFVQFEVVENMVDSLEVGRSFQLSLAPNSKEKFRSGDILEIAPPSGGEERSYSIGKNQRGEIFLSIKLHEHGVCSSYLSQCVKGDVITGRIQDNPEFHFPKSREKIICICNGTGIAPFIGMAHENTERKRFDLYWGGRSQQELDKYYEQIQHVQDINQLASFQFTFSREGEKEYKYVQDLIRGDKNNIATSLSNDAAVLICGSIAMRDDVLNELDIICQNQLGKSLEHFEKKGQIKVDCY